MMKLKAIKKKKSIIKTLFYLLSILLFLSYSFLSYFCHLFLPNTLLCSLVCLFVPLFFLSCLCLVTLYCFHGPSLKIPFLFSSCTCSSSHIPHTLTHPQCFHTLSPFKPFVLYFFFMLLFTLALCHICSIFSILSLNSQGYICSAAWQK